MREGSTLIPEKGPDRTGCCFEERLYPDEGSEVVVLGHALGVVITTIVCAGAFEFAVLTEEMLTLGPLPFIAVSAVALFRQAEHVVRHWVHYSTAAPCHPEVMLEARQRIQPSALSSMLAFPMRFLPACYHLATNLGEAFEAWHSYLAYGGNDKGQPGVFLSPCGPWYLRTRQLYITAAFASLSMFRLPSLLAYDFTFTVLEFIAPAVACFIVPALVLAPYLSNLRRIRDEAEA